MHILVSVLCKPLTRSSNCKIVERCFQKRYGRNKTLLHDFEDPGNAMARNVMH